MNPFTTGQDLRRLNEIIGILFKHGFSDLVRRLNLAAPMVQAGKLLRYPVNRDTFEQPPAVRFRRALEDMGPTFVKLGQVLATRVDLLDQNWIDELEKLQDRAPALPFSVLHEQLTQSLGRAPEDVFRHIDETPIGTASMAQVHRATTHSGEEVVLKIRKPGIRRIIESDLRLMHQLARLGASQSEDLRRFQPEEVVAEFDKSLQRELDFTLEARHAERMAQNLKALSYVIVPKIYWDWTCEDLNVQQFIKGIPARDVAALDASGLDRKRVALRGAEITWRSVLIDGFFHADPHPGNFLILPENRIAMLDFGMVGRLSTQRREQLVQLVRSVVLQDVDGCAQVLLQWSQGHINYDALLVEGEAFMERYYGLTLSQVNLNALLGDVIAIIRNHNIVLPTDITLLAKAALTLEGFGRVIDPDFDVMASVEPMIRELARRRYAPRKLARRLGQSLIERVDALFAETPSQPSRRTTRTQALQIDYSRFEKMTRRLEKSTNNQTRALLTAAALLASVAIMFMPQGPHIFGLHVLGVLGFMVTILQSFWLLFVLWWTQRSLD